MGYIAASSHARCKVRRRCSPRAASVRDDDHATRRLQPPPPPAAVEQSAWSPSHGGAAMSARARTQEASGTQASEREAASSALQRTISDQTKKCERSHLHVRLVRGAAAVAAAQKTEAHTRAIAIVAMCRRRCRRRCRCNARARSARRRVNLRLR